jgi:hypothetical protein
MTLNLNDFDVLVFDIGKTKLVPQFSLVTAWFVGCKDFLGSCYRLDTGHICHVFDVLLGYLHIQNSHNNKYYRRNRLSHLLRQGCPSELCNFLPACPVSPSNRPVFRLPSSVHFHRLTHVPRPSAPLYRSGTRSSVWIPSNFIPASHPEPLRSRCRPWTSTSRRPSCRTRSCQVAHVLGRVQLNFFSLNPASHPQPL